MICLYLFSKTFSSHSQAKTSPRSNELVKRFETQKIHFSMSQHQGFRAFCRETSASETLQSAIAAHTILEENLKKRHLCCQCECTFSRMITLRHPSWRWRSSILHENLWRKLSKCKEKARFDPKVRNNKWPEAVFVFALSGALQFFFNTTTATTAIFSPSAIIFPWCTVFKEDCTAAQAAGSSVTFLAM